MGSREQCLLPATGNKQVQVLTQPLSQAKYIAQYLESFKDDFHVDRAEKSVLKPNWLITCIPGIQQSFMRLVIKVAKNYFQSCSPKVYQ